MLGKLFDGWRKVAPKPDYSFLHAQIIATIEMLIRVRGRDWLLQPETAIVARNDYDVFLTQSTDEIYDRQESALAFVYLKDMAFYEEFTTIQADRSLQNSAPGHMAVNYRADQLAKQLLEPTGR
jgi:hypothetical protein